jgi:hypothetical protein
MGWRLACVGVALAPDLDYPLQWYFGIHLPVRYTHSLGFGAGIAAAGVAWLACMRRHGWATVSLRWVAASFSHLLLDSLVAVYPEPWLWPVSMETHRLPFGILPSAGRPEWGNAYLYRNLAIEAGILGPLIYLARGPGAAPGTRSALAKGLVAAILIAACFIGFNLRRG